MGFLPLKIERGREILKKTKRQLHDSNFSECDWTCPTPHTCTPKHIPSNPFEVHPLRTAEAEMPLTGVEGKNGRSRTAVHVRFPQTEVECTRTSNYFLASLIDTVAG